MKYRINMSATAHCDFEKPISCDWTKKSVEDLASEIAEKLGYSPLVDIGQIVARLGGRIANTDWFSAQNSGSIEVRGPNDFTINLSPLSGDCRSRFTIAHELGHYVLHSRLGRKPIKAERNGSGRVEWEANWFAAGFLMPEKEFRQKKQTEGFGVARLAEHFGVSQAAAQVRFDSL